MSAMNRQEFTAQAMQVREAAAKVLDGQDGKRKLDEQANALAAFASATARLTWPYLYTHLYSPGIRSRDD